MAGSVPVAVEEKVCHFLSRFAIFYHAKAKLTSITPGIFSTTFTGPGQIWMQSSNFQKFTDAVQQTVVEDDTMDRGGANDSV